MDTTVEMLSTEYHHQNFKYDGQRYFLDSFDRFEFELHENALDGKQIETCTASNNEELVKKIKAILCKA